MASTRRLAAIMFTDTVGYTASTQTDEAQTLELLRRQQELIRPLLGAHQGREIKSTGDGFLVEFDSALKATQCAVDIQRRIFERNAEGTLTPIKIRIGVHLGDVVESGSDILGDAVNIAARIEPTAEPGGISVSGAVREQVWNKIPDKLEKLPPTALKGLQLSMEIYRVVLPWSIQDRGSQSAVPTGIAVLPFSNISPDPKDEYFADGLTEELISVLSQLRDLRVIARTSVTPYKSTTKGVAQIGAELGVSSILEGSVRKAGNRLRITVQLIDVASQGHVWADTYDRELDDVFALQSEMAKKVAQALQVKLFPRDQARLDRRTPPRPDSYLEYLQGRTQLHSITEDALRGALQHFERAIALDDRNAAAHAGAADVHRILGPMYRHLPRAEWDSASREHSAKALELDPDLAEAHASSALILWDDYEFARAEEEFKTTLSLNPSFAWARVFYGDLLSDLARPEESLREYAIARQLDPLATYGLNAEIQLLVFLRRLDEAGALLEKLGRIDDHGLLYHSCRLNLFFARDDLPECLKEVQILEKLLPGRRDIFDAGYAFYCAWTGRQEEARKLVKGLEELPESIRQENQIAVVYGALNDLDGCFHWLELAVKSKRFSPRVWRLEPRFARVRDDPRFQVLLKSMGLA